MKDGPEYTFGHSPACITLQKILENHPKAKNKIGKFIADAGALYNEVPLHNRKLGVVFAEMVNQRMLERLTKLTEIPDEVRSYVQNVLSMKFKLKIRTLWSLHVTSANPLKGMKIKNKHG